MLSLMAMAAALAPLVFAATSPSGAIANAHADARRIPPHDRPYIRYLWYPVGWTDEALLTRSIQAMLSDRGDFPNPVRVCPHLYRLDARESGWDRQRKNGTPTGLQVWEKYLDIDIFFHAPQLFKEDSILKVYYPPGTYDGKWFTKTQADVRVKAGETIVRPAPWANPLVDAGPGLETTGQDELRKLLYTEVPILCGPFFLVRALRQFDLDNIDRGLGYYSFLGLRNRNDLFDFVGLDEKVAREKFTELRELVKRSGISNQERIVGMLRGTTGRIFFTLDVKSQKGRGQPARNLRPGELDHDAEEWIAHKPDGLPINSLNAAKANAANNVKAGDVQANAPDFIGGNRSAANVTNDLRIHPNSCWDCHAANGYLMPVDEWARSKFRPGKAELRDPDKEVLDELRFLYLRDLQYELKRDRELFTRSIAMLTSTGPKDPGLTVAAFGKKIQGAYYGYIWPTGGVTVDIAAAEIGVTKERLIAGLRAYNAKRGASDQILSDFLETPPNYLTRLAFEDSYALAAVLALGITPPEEVIRAKKFGTAVKEKAP